MLTGDGYPEDQVVCAPRLMGVILQHCKGRVDHCIGVWGWWPVPVAPLSMRVSVPACVRLVLVMWRLRQLGGGTEDQDLDKVLPPQKLPPPPPPRGPPYCRRCGG